MEELERKLDKHISDEEHKLHDLHSDIRLIKENHLAHIERSVVAHEATLAGMKMDMWWVKWLITATLGAVIVGIVGVLFSKLH